MKKPLFPLRRRPTGMTLGLVAVCALLIIVVLGAGFEFMVYMGSSQELKNSVDASALNVSTRAVENKVLASFVPGYEDVADSTQGFGLTNINRLCGKAYLINANAQEMNQTGYMSGIAAQNCEMAYGNLEKINGRLFTLLNSKDAADVHFNQIALDKPAKLMGAGGSVRSSGGEGNWATACLYRGEESNILVKDADTIPKAVTPNLIKHNDLTFLQGYNAMEAYGRHFCLTTFHADEAPHLVSASTFDQAFKSPVANAVNPIPNAFRTGGEVNGKISMAAAASSVANPMRSYQLTIPHAYVTISYENEAQWYVQGRLHSTTRYDHNTGKVWQVKSYKLNPPAKGTLNGYAMLGQEYQPDNVWQAISALPGDHSPILNRLLQRIKEFCPGYSMNQMKTLMESQSLGDVPSYYIYPVYESPDNTDPQVRISPAGVGVPRWLQGSPADGNEKLVVTEYADSNHPNYCWSVIAGPYPTDRHFTGETGLIYWRPGTGWSQNLGDVRIHRTTAITFTGMP